MTLERIPANIVPEPEFLMKDSIQAKAESNDD